MTLRYNVRWKENGEWITAENYQPPGPVKLTDAIVSTTLVPGELTALVVLKRVLTNPITLICAKCGNPLEDTTE